MFDALNRLIIATESDEGIDDDFIVTDALEAEIFLTALKEECASEEEYDSLVTENAIELELYGLIHDAEIVTEARKNIVKLNKQASMNAIQKRTAIRLAQKADSPEYKLYSKSRKLMMTAREKIYAKYESKAKSIAKKAIANSRRKASAMKSDSGQSIADKMEKVIDKNK